MQILDKPIEAKLWSEIITCYTCTARLKINYNDVKCEPRFVTIPEVFYVVCPVCTRRADLQVVPWTVREYARTPKE